MCRPDPSVLLGFCRQTFHYDGNRQRTSEKYLPEARCRQPPGSGGRGEAPEDHLTGRLGKMNFQRPTFNVELPALK